MSGGGQAPTPYQPPNQAAAAAGSQAGTNALAAGGTQLSSTAAPGFQNIYSNVLNNPYAAGAQTGAGTVAAGGSNLYNTSMANANNLSALGTNLGQYGNQIIQTGFDPQQALYNQQYQLNQDQTNAINSMYGVGGSPYGAGLASQSSQNFNIGWQNQQQARQNAAIAALGQLSSTQSGLYTGAQNLGDAALQMLTTTSGAPSQAYLGQQSAVDQALSSMVQGTTGAYGLTSQSVSDENAYLGLGQSASAGALNAWQAQQQADQAFWQGIGSMITGVGGMKTSGGSSVGGDLLGMIGIWAVPAFNIGGFASGLMAGQDHAQAMKLKAAQLQAYQQQLDEQKNKLLAEAQAGAAGLQGLDLGGAQMAPGPPQGAPGGGQAAPPAAPSSLPTPVPGAQPTPQVAPTPLGAISDGW